MGGGAGESGALTSFAELHAHAPIKKVRNDTSLYVYFRAAASTLRESRIYQDEGNLELSYVLLLRYVNLVLHTLSKHKDYTKPEFSTLASQAKRNCADALSILEALKTTLREKFDRIQAEQAANAEAEAAKAETSDNEAPAPAKGNEWVYCDNDTDNPNGPVVSQAVFQEGGEEDVSPSGEVEPINLTPAASTDQAVTDDVESTDSPVIVSAVPEGDADGDADSDASSLPEVSGGLCHASPLNCIDESCTLPLPDGRDGPPAAPPSAKAYDSLTDTDVIVPPSQDGQAAPSPSASTPAVPEATTPVPAAADPVVNVAPNALVIQQAAPAMPQYAAPIPRAAQPVPQPRALPPQPVVQQQIRVASRIHPAPPPYVDPCLAVRPPRQMTHLRRVVVYGGMMSEFLGIAEANTRRNIETCGILCGTVKKGVLYITALVIPKQTGTPDQCSTTHEEELTEFQITNDLMTIGWIHTHPTQTCFMSSVDLHTHFAYQSMLPESIAIVMAPSSSPNFGIFSVLDPEGVQVLGNCPSRGFHSHPPRPIYAHCTHVDVDWSNSPYAIHDLRNIVSGA